MVKGEDSMKPRSGIFTCKTIVNSVNDRFAWLVLKWSLTRLLTSALKCTISFDSVLNYFSKFYAFHKKKKVTERRGRIHFEQMIPNDGGFRVHSFDYAVVLIAKQFLTFGLLEDDDNELRHSTLRLDEKSWLAPGTLKLVCSSIKKNERKRTETLWQDGRKEREIDKKIVSVFHWRLISWAHLTVFNGFLKPIAIWFG